MQTYLYALELKGGYVYVGITKDLARRISKHVAGSGALITRLRPPKRILAVQMHTDWATAARAERELKGLTRSKKLDAIEQIGIARNPAVDEAAMKLLIGRSARSPNSAEGPLRPMP